jgi:hypothetical protein
MSGPGWFDVRRQIRGDLVGISRGALPKGVGGDRKLRGRPDKAKIAVKHSHRAAEMIVGSRGREAVLA